MKIARFNDDRIGVVKNDSHIVDVSEVIRYRVEKGPQRVVEEIIDRFEDYRPEFERIAARAAGEPLGSVKLLAPVPRPSKCLAAFVNYLDRPDRTPESLPNEYFYKAPELVGPDGTIELPDIPAVVVYQAEAELAFVMRRTPKNVKEADAMRHVFGYVPFFDVSARGLARRTQFVPKGQDTHGPCGPWVTTADEVPDPHDLVVKSWVNGQPRQNYNTRHMAHRIPAQIAWLSRFVQFQPGDVVATGTYHEGLGPINDGDLLEIEIERLGRARFFVKGYGPRKDAEWLPGVSQPSAPGGRITPV
jgi:2-keto-4-pentenoate hydratase/2-oxohepta-3-ene-1,7-dioic acid hydratase in catechol pathway